MTKREIGLLLLSLFVILFAVLYDSYYSNIGTSYGTGPTPTQADIFSKPTNKP